MCPGVCDCLSPRQRWYVCTHCSAMEREPAAYRATVGTRDTHFRVFSFCCSEHYITWLRGY